MLYDRDGQPRPAVEHRAPRLVVEPHMAAIAFERGEAVECSVLAESGCAAVYLPLKAPMRVRGIIAVAPTQSSPEQLSAQRPHLETMASLVAIHYPAMAPLAFIWAAFIGASRLLLGVHFLTDLIAGALLGSGCALLVLL